MMNNEGGGGGGGGVPAISNSGRAETNNGLTNSIRQDIPYAL